MRILLDEYLPQQLRGDLPGHEVTTVARMGWAGIKNGALLRQAAETFGIFMAIDQNLR